jgi:hypothetical protein
VVWEPKRKTRKERALKVLQVVVFILSLLIVLGSFGILIYYKFYPRSSIFISPLGKQKANLQKSDIEKNLLKANITFNKITINSDSSFVVYLSDGSEVIFSSKKDIQSQISSLQFIRSRLTIEGKRFKSLDFRFDKPLIVF